MRSLSLVSQGIMGVMAYCCESDTWPSKGQLIFILYTTLTFLFYIISASSTNLQKKPRENKARPT